jgi:hypothetical protein
VAAKKVWEVTKETGQVAYKAVDYYTGGELSHYTELSQTKTYSVEHFVSAGMLVASFIPAFRVEQEIASQANNGIKSGVNLLSKGKNKTPVPTKPPINTGKNSGIVIDEKGNIVVGPRGKEQKPNSSMDRVDENGNLIQRRYYDENGNAKKDTDFTDHGNPKEHPKVPHEHDWDWSKKTPRGPWK